MCGLFSLLKRELDVFLINDEGFIMNKKVFTYTVEHEIFEVGDIVTPKSKRSSLEVMKPYTVTSCYEPKYEGDVVCVFVDGHRTGVNGADLMLFSEFQELIKQQ